VFCYCSTRNSLNTNGLTDRIPQLPTEFFSFVIPSVYTSGLLRLVFTDGILRIKKKGWFADVEVFAGDFTDGFYQFF